MNDAPKLIGHETLMAIKKKLRGLPRVKRVKMYTPPEAVDALAMEIKALSNKGYEPNEIVTILAEEGIEASLTRVRKAMVTHKAEAAAPPPRRSDKANAVNQANAARLQDALSDDPPEEEEEGGEEEEETADEPETPGDETGEAAHRRSRLESMLNS